MDEARKREGQNRSVKLSIMLTPSAMDRLLRHAWVQQRSRSAMAAILIEQRLDQLKQQEMLQEDQEELEEREWADNDEKPTK